MITFLKRLTFSVIFTYVLRGRKAQIYPVVADSSNGNVLLVQTLLLRALA